LLIIVASSQESDQTTQWIREAVKIRQEAQDVMNRDEAVFLLSHVYNDLLLSAATTAATPSGDLSVRKRRQLLPKQVMRVVPSGECLRSKVRTVVWVAGKNCVIPLTRAIL